MIRFVVYFAGKEEKTLVSRTLPVSIGRSPENQLVIDNLMVSRHHCEVDYRDGRFYLRDLGSDNGTYIGSELVTEEKLRDGTEFLVGKHVIRFEITDPGLRGEGRPSKDLAESDTQGERTMALESDDLRRIVTRQATRKQGVLVVQTSGRRVRLTRPWLIVGRAPGADLILEGWRVAPRHALVAHDGNAYVAIDLTGRQRTRVDGRRIDQAILRPGSVIQIGGHQVVFQEEAVKDR